MEWYEILGVVLCVATWFGCGIYGLLLKIRWTYDYSVDFLSKIMHNQADVLLPVFIIIGGPISLLITSEWGFQTLNRFESLLRRIESHFKRPSHQ